MRLKPEERRSVIINAAVDVAKSSHLSKVTHATVAEKCVVSTSVATVKKYFPHRNMLWKAVCEAEPMFEDQGRYLGVQC